jgi:hypothetical protein
VTERGDFVTAIVVGFVCACFAAWGFKEFLAKGLFE